MGRRFSWRETILNTLKHRFTGKRETLNRKITTSDSFFYPRGDLWSWKVTSSFSATTVYMDILAGWKHLQCVKVDDTNRLLCNMTLSQIIVKSTHLIQRVKRNTMLTKWMACLSWVKNYNWKTCFVKRLFWEFLLSVSPTAGLRSNLKTSWRKNVKRAIKSVFRGAVALMVSYTEKKITPPGNHDPLFENKLTLMA